MDGKYTIPLNGLAAGKNVYDWKAGKEFFESFDNAEILDAGLDVGVVVEKSGKYVGVDCRVEGQVTVECDRCLDELEMPVDVTIRLSVKYGSEESSEAGQEGEREVIFVAETDAELDMSQIIYDYVCLSLPMQRTHADGACNPAAMKYFTSTEEVSDASEDDMQNPFAALKDMFR